MTTSSSCSPRAAPEPEEPSNDIGAERGEKLDEVVMKILYDRIARKLANLDYAPRAARGPVEELQEALADMAREKRDLTLKLERVLRLVPATSAQRGW